MRHRQSKQRLVSTNATLFSSCHVRRLQGIWASHMQIRALSVAKLNNCGDTSLETFTSKDIHFRLIYKEEHKLFKFILLKSIPQIRTLTLVNIISVFARRSFISMFIREFTWVIFLSQASPIKVEKWLQDCCQIFPAQKIFLKTEPMYNLMHSYFTAIFLSNRNALYGHQKTCSVSLYNSPIFGSQNGNNPNVYQHKKRQINCDIS